MITFVEWQKQFKEFKQLTNRKIKLCASNDRLGSKKTAAIIEAMGALPKNKRGQAFQELMSFWKKSIADNKCNYRDIGWHIGHAIQVQPPSTNKTPLILDSIKLLESAYRQDTQKGRPKTHLPLLIKETAENMSIIATFAAKGKASPRAINAIINFVKECCVAHEIEPAYALFEMSQKIKYLEESKRLSASLNIIKFCAEQHEEEALTLGDASENIIDVLKLIESKPQKILLGSQVTKWALTLARDFPEDGIMAVNKARWLCDIFNNACSVEIDNDVVCVKRSHPQGQGVKGLCVTFKKALNSGQGSITIQSTSKPALF